MANNYINQFTQSLGLVINNDELDTEEFYNQVGFFLEMMEQERLIIRKTEHPSHEQWSMLCAII